MLASNGLTERSAHTTWQPWTPAPSPVRPRSHGDNGLLAKPPISTAQPVRSVS